MNRKGLTRMTGMRTLNICQREKEDKDMGFSERFRKERAGTKISFVCFHLCLGSQIAAAMLLKHELVFQK